MTGTSSTEKYNGVCRYTVAVVGPNPATHSDVVLFENEDLRLAKTFAKMLVSFHEPNGDGATYYRVRIHDHHEKLDVDVMELED